MSPLPVMLLLVAPTAASGIHLVAAATYMCPAEAGSVVADEVLVPPDMHCSPIVGAAIAIVVVVAIVAASVAGDAIVAVSVAAVIDGVVAVVVATLTALSAAVPFTLLVFLA